MTVTMTTGADNANGNDNDSEASGGGSNTADTHIDNRAGDVPVDAGSGSDFQQATTSEAVAVAAVPASAVEPAPATLKFRAFPHGVYSVVVSFWSGFAWLICYSQDGCDYARVTGPSIADITNNPSTPFIDTGFSHYRAPTLKNGEWVLDMTTPCVEYDTDIVTIGAAAKFAKIASFLASVLGGAGAIFIWFSICLVMDKTRWRWVACELLAASVLQALSFTSFASSLCQTNHCSMYYGARTNLLACIVWAVSALALFWYVPRARVTSGSAQQQLPSQAEVPNRNNDAIGNQAGTAAPGVPEII